MTSRSIQRGYGHVFRECWLRTVRLAACSCSCAASVRFPSAYSASCSVATVRRRAWSSAAAWFPSARCCPLVFGPFQCLPFLEWQQWSPWGSPSVRILSQAGMPAEWPTHALRADSALAGGGGGDGLVYGVK